MKTLCKEMDARIRCRLRMCIWKQWKTPQNRINNLIKLGVDKDTARITAYTGNRIAYVCQRRVMNFAINKERLTVRRHIVGGINRTLISVKLPSQLCRTGTRRRLSAA